MKVSVYIALIVGLIEGVLEYFNIFNINSLYLKSLTCKLPLSLYGLSWAVFSILGFIIGNVICKINKT
jgi:branched-subunit amino acid permease